MPFRADLHIHSRFSRATSRDCNLEELAFWACRKGIRVLGTGDFTHPGWMEEIRAKLVPAEPGLFRLRDDLADAAQKRLPPSCRDPVRFILEVEISTIYKKGERTRKVHHLVFVPGLEEADRLARRLARIGNLNSDGRPILGLDSRDLLEIALESGDGAFLIPAHIWTPWFSVLGSNSGFDAVAECYGDLALHVFALETGLSSDPPMNWRLSGLDRYRLVSNSDAHSPAKLGREACVFDTAPDYFAMRRALETGQGYAGTVEFFPEEGKYHLDGHRKCGVRLSPEETRTLGGRCSVCGKAVTVGVMHRVAELADRPESTRLEGAAPFRSLVPLPEVLGEIIGVGPDSRKVTESLKALVHRLGPELQILEHVPIPEIERVASTLLAEAVRRMREGRVIREAGYDGEYGIIHLFAEDELKNERSGDLLFQLPDAVPEPARRKGQPKARTTETETPAPGPQQIREPRAAYASEPRGILECLDPDQRAAAEIVRGPVLIIAGPGTGKTLTLTHRIAHLVSNHGVPPEQCLAITFTRRAAGEMLERLHRLLPGQADRIPVMTFHALGHAILREHGGRIGLPPGFRVVSEEERKQIVKESPACEPRNGQRGILVFDDLIALPVRLLEEQPDLAADCRRRHPWVSVDEFQDMDGLQYRLLQLLVPPEGNVCAIGDPDQAIYGFRGSDAGLCDRFVRDFPGARMVHLTRNYRSGRSIVEASQQVIEPTSLVKGRILRALADNPERIVIHEAATDRAEAEFVVHSIERMIGGSTFFSMDSGRVEAPGSGGLAFSDFAVLYRTDAQADALCEALARSGMPFQKRSHASLADVPAVRQVVGRMKEGGSGCLVERLEQVVRDLADEQSRREAESVLPAPTLGAVESALRSLAGRCGSLEVFLSELALGVDVDLWDLRADRVSLLTLHASKGLEFPVVFIVGCEDGVLPLRWGKETREEDVAEERRLFFVGMTRARDRLFLCHARRRAWRGAVRPMTESPFLRAIREELLERSRSESRPRRPAGGGEQLTFL